MNKVNLFIIGAAKSGTTALYHYLDKHPDIFMCPVKEPHYFSKVQSSRINQLEKPKPGKKYHTRIINNEDIYHSLFQDGHGYRYRGEASPSYLWDDNAAERIYNYNPNAMIIAILRDPIERAFSHYQMSYQLGLESESTFISALRKDDKEGVKIWGRAPLYIELGNYYSQLKRYSELFSNNQIMVIKSNYLKNSPRECLNEISEFLNVVEFDPDINIIERSKNNAKKNRFRWVRSLRNSWLRSIFKNFIGEKSVPILKKILYKKNVNGHSDIDSESRKFLKDKYEKELIMLKKEFKIDFRI